MNGQQSTAAPAQLTRNSGELRAQLETAVELLRGEWRAGFPGGMGVDTALGIVRRGLAVAPNAATMDRLEKIRVELVAYKGLPAERRPAALRAIADDLKRTLADVPTRAPAAVSPRSTSRVKQPAQAVPATPVTRSGARRSTIPAGRKVGLHDPVTVLKGAGGATSKKLARLGVETIRDLLYLVPRRHIDYSRTIRIGEALNLRPGSDVTVRGKVTDVQLHRGPGAPRVTIRLADETGWVRVTWFNQYLANVLRVGSEIAVSGALERGYGPLSFTGPEWERVGGESDSVSTGRIVPVYPLTAGLAQKSMRSLARQALEQALGNVEDHLPPALLSAAGENLPPLQEAIRQIHFPDDQAALAAAKRRLGFDELFLLQLGLVRRKLENRSATGVALQTPSALLETWREGLPFRFTASQETALEEILADLATETPMARLLQGDVGSGKTVIAAAAMLAATANGYQSALMAPTEILAGQHSRNLEVLYAGLPDTSRPRLRLLTGSTPAAERREILRQSAAGEIDILVGTHALIQDGVELPKLALTVVDEQHRFGVKQRAVLPNKAEAARPHQLAMTATPIPRTLNLVLHGDLDVSILSERPPGRIPIETRRYVGAERSEAYRLVRQQVREGYQVFVICPLVEASESIEAKAAVEEAERLSREVFPDLRIATLHGRMKPREKDEVMTAFRDRAYDVLVSTSVIEVGIDIPNATVMLIEGADRFGLAQLHQFRGRVGRGGARSYCLLLAEETSAEGEERLQAMVDSDDGFYLAEKDLELRGPGDFIGTRQSGLPEMLSFEGIFDVRLLDQARRAAEAILSEDPELSHPDHIRLGERLAEFWERVALDATL